jgi:NAD(P)-dependent dehydrogenase (short-subunit alcohol dehydrogenase family)
MRFDGRVAIITGGGGGLGPSHAVELARRGAAVLVNDLGGALDGSGASASAAQLVVDEIVAAGGRATSNHDSVYWAVQFLRRMGAATIDGLRQIPHQPSSVSSVSPNSEVTARGQLWS